MSTTDEGLNIAGNLLLGLGSNPHIDYQYVRALAYGNYGAASVGEVIRVAGNANRRGDTRQTWVDAWNEQADICRRLGDESRSAGRARTAGHHFLRAYNYYRSAEFFFDRKRWGAAAHREVNHNAVHCFDEAMRAWRQPMEKIRIPYLDGVEMPGYFFKAHADDRPTPTIIFNGGGDSFGEESYFTGGVPEALARGMNALLYHGPGQRGVIHEHPGIVFRPDTEVPVGKVLDYMLARPDVDPERVGIVGYSFGGYLAPRAAAFDHRIKALVANAPLPNIVELLKPLLQLPEAAKDADWSVEAITDQAMFWNTGTDSIPDFIAFISRFRLTDEMVRQIRCPTLCLFAEGEGPGPKAQAESVYRELQCPKSWYTLTEEMGADNHCGLNNIAHTACVVHDWFATVFGIDLDR